MAFRIRRTLRPRTGVKWISRTTGHPWISDTTEQPMNKGANWDNQYKWNNQNNRDNPFRVRVSAPVPDAGIGLVVSSGRSAHGGGLVVRLSRFSAHTTVVMPRSATRISIEISHIIGRRSK